MASNDQGRDQRIRPSRSGAGIERTRTVEQENKDLGKQLEKNK